MRSSATSPSSTSASMIKAAPRAGEDTRRGDRSIRWCRRFVKDEHLRQALSLPHAAGRRQPDDDQRDLRADPQAGEGRRRLVRQGRHPRADPRRWSRSSSGWAARCGSAIRSSAIDTLGDRATGVTHASGWHGDFDAVASNADVMHTYRDAARRTRSAAQRRRSALEQQALLAVAVRRPFRHAAGRFPGIPHHTILFGPRYKGLLTDIYDHGVLAKDFSLYLHHPTVTDPDARAGGLFDLLRAGAGAASRQAAGRLGRRSGRSMPTASSTSSRRRLIPGLRERLVTSFHYTPAGFRAAT